MTCRLFNLLPVNFAPRQQKNLKRHSFVSKSFPFSYRIKTGMICSEMDNRKLLLVCCINDLYLKCYC